MANDGAVMGTVWPQGTLGALTGVKPTQICEALSGVNPAQICGALTGVKPTKVRWAVADGGVPFDALTVVKPTDIHAAGPGVMEGIEDIIKLCQMFTCVLQQSRSPRVCSVNASLNFCVPENCALIPASKAVSNGKKLETPRRTSGATDGFYIATCMSDVSMSEGGRKSPHRIHMLPVLFSGSPRRSILN